MATLSLQNLRKTYDKLEVIKGINLDIQDKEFVVFVGPSGCGKSTMLRMIAGLEEISSGDLYIDDTLVNEMTPFERGISMVFQSYALYPHMTVFDNIAFPLQVERMPKADIKKRVQATAETLQLTNYLYNLPRQLSGGQRQRVAIGRCIVRNPKVFLFDEPLSNLDAALRGNMRVELSQLHKKLNATMIYVTHDQTEAMTMADKIVVLRDGIIEQVGSPMALYNHPENKFVASFIGTPKMNFLNGKIVKTGAKETTVSIDAIGQLSIPFDTQNAQAGETISFGLRPEHCYLEPSDLFGKLTVSIVEHLGGHTIAYGKVGGEDFAISLDGEHDVSEEQTTTFYFAKNKCYLFDANGRSFKRMI